jgi:hypothetical protein
VLAGLLVPVMGDLAWRLAFVAGLAGVAGVHRLVSRLPTVLIDGS